METSLYAAMPALAELYGRAVIDNLHDRVGDLVQLGVRIGEVPWDNGAWVRSMTWRGRHDGGDLGIYSDKGPDFEFDLDGLQGGFSFYLDGVAGSSVLSLGVYGAVGDARATVDHVRGIRAGVTTIDAYSVGGYATTFWPNGAYVDAVAQYSWYDAEARSSEGLVLKTDTAAWALSLEGGWPFSLGDQWVVQPQLQMTYQSFDGDLTGDKVSEVSISHTDSLVGRVGLRLSRTFEASGPGVARYGIGWLRLNLGHEFVDDPIVNFASADGPITFESDLGRWWGEVNAGGTYQLVSNVALFASVGYTRALDDDIHAYTGKFGVKISW